MMAYYIEKYRRRRVVGSNEIMVGNAQSEKTGKKTTKHYSTFPVCDAPDLQYEFSISIFSLETNIP